MHTLPYEAFPSDLLLFINIVIENLMICFCEILLNLRKIYYPINIFIYYILVTLDSNSAP